MRRFSHPFFAAAERLEGARFLAGLTRLRLGAGLGAGLTRFAIPEGVRLGAGLRLRGGLRGTGLRLGFGAGLTRFAIPEGVRFGARLRVFWVSRLRFGRADTRGTHARALHGPVGRLSKRPECTILVIEQAASGAPRLSLPRD